MKACIAAVPMFVLLTVTGAASAQDTQPTNAETQPAAAEVRKDTLLIERVREENKSVMPSRGQTMARR